MRWEFQTDEKACSITCDCSPRIGPKVTGYARAEVERVCGIATATT